MTLVYRNLVAITYEYEQRTRQGSFAAPVMSITFVSAHVTYISACAVLCEGSAIALASNESELTPSVGTISLPFPGVVAINGSPE